MARSRTVKKEGLDPEAPADIKLQSTGNNTEVKEAASKESIEAAINDKLSRRTDSEGENPFVPLSQLENEVKEIANKEGFPLTRGTEIGARLLARSLRMNG